MRGVLPDFHGVSEIEIAGVKFFNRIICSLSTSLCILNLSYVLYLALIDFFNKTRVEMPIPTDAGASMTSNTLSSDVSAMKPAR